jgi:MFS family permease
MARAQVLWVLYLARVLDGVTAGNLSLAQAYISDHTEPHERAKAFGLIGVAFGIGFFIGPSLTGYLAARHGMTTPIYLAAAMSAMSILCTVLLLKGGREVHHAFDERGAALNPRTYARYFARGPLRSRLLQFLCFITAFSLFISGFALFAERRFVWNGHPFGPREIGFVFGYVGLLGIILQGGLIGRLVTRFGEARLVAVGCGLLTVGYVGLGLASTVALLLVTGTVAAIGNGIIRPSVTSLITHHASRAEQGVIAGLTQALMSVASIVAPIVGGFLIQHGMLTSWAWTAGVLAMVGALISRQDG